MRLSSRKQSTKPIQIKFKGTASQSVLAAPNTKFKANIQKYVELHAKSKQLLEQLHSRRTGSAGFPQVRGDGKRRKNDPLMQSLGGKANFVPNSWMRQTEGQKSKKRKKAGVTEDFFETVVDEELQSIDERLASLKKIYISGARILRPPTAETLKYF